MTENCIKEFQQRFKQNGGICCFAPGRVNLIGEHTDYNGGFVLPCAITMGIYAVAAKRNDNKLGLFSMNFSNQDIIEIPLNDIKKSGTWADYPAGVVNTLMQFGYKIGGANILFYGDLPGGAGLSSSAAIEVLTVTVMCELFSLSVEKSRRAEIGRYAENRFVGVNCGIMDQFAVAMGQKSMAILLNTNTLEYNYLPIPQENADIVIINSMVKRSLNNSAYNDRRNQCEQALSLLQKEINANTLCEITGEQFEKLSKNLPDVIRQRARHVILENERVLAAASFLQNNDLTSFGALMNDSHKSLKEDFEVSCKELDFLAQTSQEYPKVYGSRMTGAGFGGCTVTVIDKTAADGFICYISKQYQKRFSVSPKIYKTSPSDGARKLLEF